MLATADKALARATIRSPIVRWNEPQRPRTTRRLAGVAGVVDSIGDRYLGKIERAYPIKARHVHGE